MVREIGILLCLKCLIDWKALNHSTKSSGNSGEREVKSNGNSERFDRKKSAQSLNEIIWKFRGMGVSRSLTKGKFSAVRNFRKFCYTSQAKVVCFPVIPETAAPTRRPGMKQNLIYSKSSPQATLEVHTAKVVESMMTTEAFRIVWKVVISPLLTEVLPGVRLYSETAFSTQGERYFLIFLT